MYRFPPKWCVEDWRLGSFFIQKGQRFYCLFATHCMYWETCSLLESFSYLDTHILGGWAANQSIQQLPNRISQSMPDGCTIPIYITWVLKGEQDSLSRCLMAHRASLLLVLAPICVHKAADGFRWCWRGSTKEVLVDSWLYSPSDDQALQRSPPCCVSFSSFILLIFSLWS